jgi:hypothetical protein
MMLLMVMMRGLRLEAAHSPLVIHRRVCITG